MKKRDSNLRLSAFAMAIVLLGGIMSATAQDDFEKWLQQDQAAFKEFSIADAKAFEEYEKADREAFKKFQKEIEDKWRSFVDSDKKTWVEYGKDKNSRSVVDFEEGKATVEVLVTPEEAKNPKIVEQKVTQAVTDLVTTKGQTKDYAIPQEKPKPLKPQPVLKDQVETPSGKKVTPANAKQFAKEVVAKKPPVQEKVTGKDNQQRVKVKVEFPLAPNSLKVRAKEVSPHVSQFASKYRLPQELVFAVIHTESAFNPKAKSHIPAYGLMQIVPKFAGRDAHQFIHKKDGIPLPNYLYTEKNNIEMGAVYLHILETRYFKDVKDPRSRQLCMIAAYNTGAGNVARAFTGTTSPKKAIPLINKMSYDKVYNTLKKKLPYKETQDYIERVTTRMPLYK
jgi:membrane-bound lytic murein transglycosylase C